MSGDANIYAKCNDIKNEHMVHSSAAEHISEGEDIHDLVGSSHWQKYSITVR